MLDKTHRHFSLRSAVFEILRDEILEILKSKKGPSVISFVNSVSFGNQNNPVI